MGIREDQVFGLPPGVYETIAPNLRQTEPPCPHCKRPFPVHNQKIGSFEGMGGIEYPLHRYALVDGRFAEEFVQHTEWSSGPCIFLGLRIGAVTGSRIIVGEIRWTKAQIAERV